MRETVLCEGEGALSGRRCFMRRPFSVMVTVVCEGEEGALSGRQFSVEETVLFEGTLSGRQCWKRPGLHWE